MLYKYRKNAYSSTKYFKILAKNNEKKKYHRSYLLLQEFLHGATLLYSLVKKLITFWEKFIGTDIFGSIMFWPYRLSIIYTDSAFNTLPTYQ